MAKPENTVPANATPVPPPPVAVAATARTAAPVAGLQTPEFKPSVISDAVHFVGEMRSKGAIHIDGDARGVIEAESVTVGAGGSLDGKVACRKLHVKGHLSGEVVCDELLITDAARVQGTLRYRTILMSRGTSVTGDLQVID